MIVIIYKNLRVLYNDCEFYKSSGFLGNRYEAYLVGLYSMIVGKLIFKKQPLSIAGDCGLYKHRYFATL